MAEERSFFLLSIRYLRTIIDSHGQSADLEKVHVMVNISPRSYVNTLQPFLGMTEYYDNFVPIIHFLQTPFK